MSNGEERTNEAPPADLAPKPPNVAMTQGGFAPADMEQAWRFANALARCNFVPDTYRGKPDDCLIALDLAGRLKTHWLAVMQHVYMVHGRPGMDAVLTIGLVNQSGQFEPIQYEVQGDTVTAPNYRVRAYSRRTGSEAVLYGPWIDWPLVKSEGWYDKSGSKWKSMPEQMFHYRAGKWWQSRHCPEMTLGMPSTDELHDMSERKPVESTDVTPKAGNAAVLQKLQTNGAAKPPENPPEQPPAATIQQQAEATWGEGAVTEAPAETIPAKAEPEPDGLDAMTISQPPAGAEQPPAESHWKCNTLGCGAEFTTPETKKVKGNVLESCPKCHMRDITPVPGPAPIRMQWVCTQNKGHVFLEQPKDDKCPTCFARVTSVRIPF